MLVLSRKCDQVILIGDDIQLTVLEIRGDKVWVGINAPKGLAVDRSEVRAAKNREAAAAADRDGAGR